MSDNRPYQTFSRAPSPHAKARARGAAEIARALATRSGWTRGLEAGDRVAFSRKRRQQAEQVRADQQLADGVTAEHQSKLPAARPHHAERVGQLAETGRIHSRDAEQFEHHLPPSDIQKL